MKSLITNVHIIINENNQIYGALEVLDSKINAIYPIDEMNFSKAEYDEIIDGENQYLMPGFIDIHLHGSYGYDFIRNSKKAIDKVGEGLVKEATTSFMASLTVISHQEMCDLLDQYQHVENNINHAHFLGIHSEGPYLSVDYKALMDETYLRTPCIQELQEMIDHAQGKLKMMTIAPELDGMDSFIPYALSNDITLMMGHTNASCECALNALKQGVSGFTHLYNAMSPHTHRKAGAVTASFLAPTSFCELIVDGFHVDESIIKSTYKIIGSNQIILITDAMLAKGMIDGDYVFSGLNTRKVKQTVQVIGTGRIAGSAISMLDATRNMRKYTGCSLNEIVQMASINPAKAVHVDHFKGSLEIGKDADMILVDADLNLKKTFIQGLCVYTNNSLI